MEIRKTLSKLPARPLVREVVLTYGELAPPLYLSREKFLEIKGGFEKVYEEYCRLKEAKGSEQLQLTVDEDRKLCARGIS
jgi:hypothetical protein